MRDPIGKNNPNKLNRHMEPNEARLILEYYVKTHQAMWYLFFLVQLTMGLRVSEVSPINIKDFREDLSYLSVRLAKTDVVKEFYIPMMLRRMIYSYIQEFHKAIYARDGYLFYSFNRNCEKKYVGKCMAYLKLREAVKAIGIQDVIPKEATGFSYNANRIGTHSFRRLNTTQLMDQTDSVPFVCYYRDYGDSGYQLVKTYSDEVRFQQKEKEEVETLLQKFLQPDLQEAKDESIRSIVRTELKQLMKQFGSKDDAP